MTCQSINPKTGKPYTKHKFAVDLTVASYYVSAYGNQKPIFNQKVYCQREGCNR